MGNWVPSSVSTQFWAHLIFSNLQSSQMLSRPATYEVCAIIFYTKYQEQSCLWQIKPEGKRCKILKYYDLDCRANKIKVINFSKLTFSSYNNVMNMLTKQGKLSIKLDTATNYYTHTHTHTHTHTLDLDFSVDYA